VKRERVQEENRITRPLVPPIHANAVDDCLQNPPMTIRT